MIMAMKTQTLSLMLGLGLALAVAGAALTQSATSNQAVSYGADGGEYTPNGFALRGRAEVVQGGNRLRADSINATTTDGDLTRIEASGNVYLVTPDQSMRGDRATYTLSSEEVVVTGDVILTQGQNVLTGGRLVYNVRTEAARMEGGSTASGNRIRGVFYPQGSSN